MSEVREFESRKIQNNKYMIKLVAFYFDFPIFYSFIRIMQVLFNSIHTFFCISLLMLEVEEFEHIEEMQQR